MIAAEKTKVEVAPFPRRELKNALINLWKKQVKDREENPLAVKLPAVVPGTVRDILPELDSLTIVRSLAVVGKILKMKVPITLVKRGGYDSCQQMLDHLLPRLEKFYEKRITK
jgi:hypothetical protein